MSQIMILIECNSNELLSIYGTITIIFEINVELFSNSKLSSSRMFQVDSLMNL
jgi:hypothetical protein